VLHFIVNMFIALYFEAFRRWRTLL